MDAKGTGRSSFGNKMIIDVKPEKIKGEVQDPTKIGDSGSEDVDGSSDDAFDTKQDGPAAKRQKLEERDDEEDDDDDDEDDDRAKTDDADEHSDTAAQRQSKRKPSKSRIKRILPQQMPPGSSLSPDGHGPVGTMDGHMMMPHPNQPSMVSNPAQAYLQMGDQQRTAGGYKCEICGKEFRVPSRYDSHMLSHSKGKPFCCDICGKLFSSQQKLDTHKPVHNRNRKDSIECPTCGHECQNWRAYLYHMTKHTKNGGKKHNCEVCGRQFHAAQRLRNHMQSHIDGKHFCCLICGKLFESQKRLDTHSLIHDAERQEPFSCVDCGKVYDEWRAFKQHMKTHGSEGVIYRCEICSDQFLTQYEKEKHKRIHTSNQRYQCQQCSKCFRSQSQLSVHERKHLGNKSHDCMICGRECARASSLKQHMKLHAGEEEFFCHLCGKTFKMAEELAVHSASHVGERDFNCDQCGKGFAKKSHYHRHLLVHATGQPLTCGQCGKQFDHPTQLQSHMVTHGSNGQQKFACLACSDAFFTQLELEAHAHTHGKSPPYVCGLCGKLFAEQRYFRQHMKRHTARSLKQKMQAQTSMAATGIAKGNTAAAVMQSQEHKCHMCGQHFAHSRALVSHIEQHKRSGLLVYFNLMDNKVSKNAVRQKAQTSASDEESESASESEGSDEIANRSKTTIHYSLKTANQPASHSKGSRSSLTQAAERAMALRMQATSQNFDGSGNMNSSGTPVAHSDVSMDDRGDGEVETAQSSFYSQAVFPGQMSGSHATPYHAAAQQFQHNSQENFMDGSNQDRGEISGSYAPSQKGLPGFADFRRQLGYSTNTGYTDYQNNIPSEQFSSTSQVPSTSNYSSSSVLPPASSFLPSAGDQLSDSYCAGSSVPVYPDMSVFPGMPSQEQRNLPSVNQGDVQQQQFDPMLQFQPLSS